MMEVGAPPESKITKWVMKKYRNIEIQKCQKGTPTKGSHRLKNKVFYETNS